jgi:hypothetical protein
MNCRDFRRRLDQWLDTETRPLTRGMTELDGGRRADPGRGSVEAWDPAMADHAAGCHDCRELGAGYRLLGRALRSWDRAPVPPADLADRILSAAGSSPPADGAVNVRWQPDRPWRTIWMLASFAAAGLVLALLPPAIHRMIPGAGLDRPADRPIASPSPDRDFLRAVSDGPLGPTDRLDLQLALAEATSATWDLALTASGPATRISREVLDATTQAEEPPVRGRSDRQGAGEGGSAVDRSPSVVGLAVPIPPWLPDDADPAASASAVLQQVGDHLATGVRPLSKTARHAFGFLLGPTRDQQGARSTPPNAKGA